MFTYLCSLAFFQWRSDFLKTWVEMPINHETQEECLGMAVLDIMRLAKEKDQSPVEVYNTTRYESMPLRPATPNRIV